MADQDTVSNNSNQSFSAITAKWLAGQPFNNVLLFGILAGGAWCVWYAMTLAIPQHLATIQTGYEKIETRQSEQLKGQQETFEKVLDRVFARQQDRPEKDNHSAVAGKP